MKGKRKKSNVLVVILAGILLFVTMYPFFLLICGSLKDKMQLIDNPWFFEQPLHFENYAIAIGEVLRPLFNSLVITISGIIITILFSGLAAHAIVFSEMPGKKIIYYYIISLLMVPFFAILIPQFIAVRDMGLYNTYLGQILPLAAGELAFGTMMMCTFFKSISMSVIESAQLEGCGYIQLFGRVVLPLSKPIISTVAIMSGLHLWNNFLWPLIATNGDKVQPVILAISNIAVPFEQGDGVAYAAYVIAAFPILILFSFAAKQFVEGMMAGAVKG